MRDTLSPVSLPAAHVAGPRSFEAVLAGRRSVRDFGPGPLTADVLGQLLWAAQGVTGPDDVALEAGHAAGNIALQAVALGLGSTLVGAFEDEEVRRLLRAPRNTLFLLLLPVGPPR